ncbi:hypothetical protein LOTGIDRAFT_171724 [Lottia gigantea]|uniref:Uncharacterized protein n=1 Tax=Lottia gigantea TaxID=225164 RepID=V4B6G2_LOTGI|nr:hypothetical protein LOTGIDRAFT_171724 [Lottia gigantea]ESP03121.1 hypothetical protein LOTGIDRAFT_171724 [Lottia gigantea]
MSQRAIYRKSTGSPQQQFTPTVNNGVGPQAKAFPFKHFITLPNGVVRSSRPARGESNYHNISTTSGYSSVPVKGIHSPPVIHYTDSGPEYDRQQYLKPPDQVRYNSRVSRERHNNVNIVLDSTSQLESSVGRYRKRSKSTPPVSDRSSGDWVDNSSVRQSTRLVSNGSVKGQYITNDEVIYANVNRGSISNNRPPLFINSPASKYVVDVNHTYSSVGLVHSKVDYIRPSSPLSVYSDRGSDYVSSAGSMRGDTVIYNSPSARQDVIMMGNYYDPRDIYVDNRNNGSLTHSRAKFSSMPMLYVDKATEKKIIKEEKKRVKEERKRFEKEEKKRKKAEKKAATLNAKTLPKSWGYDVVHRNIENTYPRPRLRMRAVPIEFEDGPYVPPPLRPRYVVNPNPGLQKKHFYTSTPNLQQAIYANTPSIQRVEQVYGTSSRYALKPHIPPTNKRLLNMTMDEAWAINLFMVYCKIKRMIFIAHVCVYFMATSKPEKP